MNASSDIRSQEAHGKLRDLISETESMVAALGEQGSERYRTSVERLQRQIRRARDDLDDLQYAAVRRARAAARRTDLYVHDNPWRTAGAAAVVGAAVGALVAMLVARR